MQDSMSTHTLKTIQYGIAAIFLSTLLLLLLLYRKLLHPLSAYPGPAASTLSSWPLVFQAYTGTRHIQHYRDHAQYGPIVRISPNALSFNTASALHAIYAPRNVNVKKGEWYKTFDVAAGAYSSFTETERGVHAVKRRWVGACFAGEGLRGAETRVGDVVEGFCDMLGGLGKRGRDGDGWGAKWNASEMCTYLGFDIMGSLVFGTDFRCVQEEGNRQLALAVLPASRLMYWVYVQQKELECDKDGHSSRTDFLSHLINAEDKKTGWCPATEDLVAESLNLINAGADPFSGVLAGAIFYLVHNTHALHKATEEVRSTFTCASEIVNGAALNSCTYLFAVIEETLRRTAPVPSHLPRVVLEGGMQIDGHHIPAGTTVGVPMYALHNNPTYFPAPFTFAPKRWIESPSNPAENVALARKAFCPFSIGSRMCSGKALAYLQLKLTLAHLLWRFDVRVAPDEPGRGGGRPELGIGREREDEFQLWDALGFGRDGPMVQVRSAQGSSGKDG
ncbi:isotrichodermin C-15 hydroxylase [Stemphylium lycopersici]|uniref:Isotrichodermin C-15 hydroxylase n=1 Tax=Stemphylium lycopersici TaxID=183478 RepID=A0A364N1Z4_STELY|nr:isotrichodermin C-15 hydroxylase [Stemphylium lycopersici]